MRPDFDKLLSKKNIANLLLLGILILAIPLTVKLARERQILFSQAVNPSVVPTGANVETRNGVLVATDRDIEVQISDPGWTNSSIITDAGFVKTAYAGHLHYFEERDVPANCNDPAHPCISRNFDDYYFCDPDRRNLYREDAQGTHIWERDCGESNNMVCSIDPHENTLRSGGCFLADTKKYEGGGCNQYLTCSVFSATDDGGNTIYPIFTECEKVPGQCGVLAQPPGGGTPPAATPTPSPTPVPPAGGGKDVGDSCNADRECKIPSDGDRSRGYGYCCLSSNSECAKKYDNQGKCTNKDGTGPGDSADDSDDDDRSPANCGTVNIGNDCDKDEDCKCPSGESRGYCCTGDDCDKQVCTNKDGSVDDSDDDDTDGSPANCGTVNIGNDCDKDEDCKCPSGESRGYCCTGSSCPSSTKGKCTLKDGSIPGGTTPTPSPSPLRTVKFKIGEDPNTIDTQSDNIVIPAKIPFTLSPGFGPKTIVVKFFSDDPNITKNEQVAITLVEKDPDMSGGVSCTTELSEEKSILFKAFGVRFATQSATSKLTAGTTDLQTDSWTPTAVTAHLKPAPNYPKGQVINVTLTRADSRTQQKSCTLDTSTLALGANLLCRSAGLTRLDDVDLVVIDKNNKANKIKEKVSLDLKNGTITTDKIKSAAPGQQLKVWIDAPLSVGRSADASASAGITVVPDISIPFGDIAGPSCPALGKGDNVINAFDAACLRQQWGRVTSNTKNCDCNGDGVCNAFEWSYMKQNIPLQGETEP